MTAAIGLIVGFALFGSVTYLPLFLQVVGGATPTGSGLQMLPMMGGMLFTSITSGQLISRWGRFKVFPVIGTATMVIGLYLLSGMDQMTTVGGASLNMLVLGLGLGLVTQVLIMAVQNAVDYADLGVATSGATLFRLIGGSLGTAIFGALFANRLDAFLARALPPELETNLGGVSGAGGAGIGLSPEMLNELPESVREIYITGFTSSLSSVFTMAMVIAVIGFVLTWLIPERPLRETIATAAADPRRRAEEIFPFPTSDDSLAKLERALAEHVDRERQREYIAEVVGRAGTELSPLAAWLLVEIGRDRGLAPGRVISDYNIDSARFAGAVQELVDHDLIEGGWVDDVVSNLPLSDSRDLPVGVPDEREPDVTRVGHELLDRLVSVRREHLLELLGEWSPRDREELASRLGWLADASEGRAPPADR